MVADPFAGFLDEGPAVVTPPAPVIPFVPPERPTFEPLGNVIGEVEAKAIMARLKATRQDDTDSNALESEIPEPEVRATPVELDDPRVPRGCRTIAKLAAKEGFELTAHYARGPWMHSSQWTVLRIAESIVLRMRHPDGRRAVAQWVTQTDPEEWKLEGAFSLTPLTPVKNDALKTYLRGS